MAEAGEVSTFQPTPTTASFLSDVPELRVLDDGSKLLVETKAFLVRRSHFRKQVSDAAQSSRTYGFCDLFTSHVVVGLSTAAWLSQLGPAATAATAGGPVHGRGWTLVDVCNTPGS